MDTHDRCTAEHLRPRVVVVSCGGRKSTTNQDVKIPAGDLYTGSYHRAARRAAEALSQGGQRARALILSAMWGLVSLHEPIAPYDLKAGEEGTVTGDQLRRQAAALGINEAHVTVLGGRAYVDLARHVWPDLTAPLEGSRGIGDHLARLADIYRRDQPAAKPTTSHEIEKAAAARQAEQAAKAALKRTQYVTTSRLTFGPDGTTAQARLDYPGRESSALARMAATRRLATTFGITTCSLHREARAIYTKGTPRQVARFASALPRILEGAETLATHAALLYGRWERHPASAQHLEDVDTPGRRELARRFREEAFEVVVETLLDPPECIEEAKVDLAPWDQVDVLAGGIAHYYWFDVADSADPDEVARHLADTDRSQANVATAAHRAAHATPGRDPAFVPEAGRAHQPSRDTGLRPRDTTGKHDTRPESEGRQLAFFGRRVLNAQPSAVPPASSFTKRPSRLRR
ncbi:DUF6884 domain-containing protein [Streptomyces sp. NPDC057565]|uniref:DUF6884 domain-containing protein n=1 Tax=Streptomyces sp. NPDC057565 TaxID=3346169 RepID=UPI0036C4EDF4